MRTFLIRVLPLSLLVLLGATPSSDTPGYYQDPALHGTTLVFVAEGDLWTVPLEGGTARRLTSHPEAASGPRISPDGRWIAFTGRYEGRPDVYVMPLEGGPVRRLTHESGPVVVEGWTPEGRILFGSAGSVGLTAHWLLRTVDPETLEIADLPLADARQGAFDGVGSLFFTRWGVDLRGDNVRGYRGGAMARLWRFGLGSEDEAEPLAADHAGNLTRPMWWDGSLYVVSDAGGLFNLWRLDLDGGAGQPLTDHRDFEVRGATLAEGRIVYQHGADIRVHDLATGRDEVVDIRLGSDRSRTLTRWLDSPLDYLNSVSLAPDGDRVALTARGHLAVVGTGDLRRIEIPLPDASRAREAILSQDGTWVYAFVDEGVQEQIWRFPADGRGQGEPLTHDVPGRRTSMVASPDGSHIAHTDRRGRLWLLDLEAGTNREIDGSRGMGYRDLVWSPDGSVLALSRADTPARRPQIVLFEVDGGNIHVLTSDRYESYAPAFTPDGRWLYFLSDRNFVATPGSPWGDRNLGPVFDQRTRIYALALQAGNRFPLQPRTELTAGEESEDADEPLPIQFEGLAERLYEVPVASGNYQGLLATGSRLYFLQRPAGSGGTPALRTIEFARDRPRIDTFAEGISMATLSADRSRLLVRRGTGNELFIVQAGAQLPSDLAEARVRVEGWRVAIDPEEEWRQMFMDAWRMQRDFYFDPGMREVDWEAVRDKYAPLVERIGDRREVDDLLGQMVAELGVLHSQVGGGEYPGDPEAASPAFLGGTFEPASGGMRITHVYRTDPEIPAARSPLARPGVELRTGDLITAVNGHSVTDAGSLARALAHQAGEQVRVDYLRQGEAGSVVTRPVSTGADALLRYSDWVTERRERVAEASDGRVGYLHLRAMGAGDMADFAREFYANIERDGLVIDVRRNSGGNIDSWVIEKLLRRAWAFWEPPGAEPFWNMQQTFRGHLVVLIDPMTYSDGEAFAAGVKALGLGPLVGQRTAGAGVWLSNNNLLVDQGIMRAAQLPMFREDGLWLIEGHGVDPDIEVENLPHAAWRGEDAQLDRAIQEVLRAIEEDPVLRPSGERIPPLGRTGRDVVPPGGGR